MNIGTATIDDAPTLTKIAFRAKAYWGYPEKWLEKWRKDLTITPDFIKSNAVFKLVDGNNQTIGFCGILEEGQVLWIEHLWLLPDHIGKGLGRKLFTEALCRCRQNHHKELRVISDPNAQPFYEKMGLKVVDRIQSWPKDRFLPVLSKKLEVC